MNIFFKIILVSITIFLFSCKGQSEAKKEVVAVGEEQEVDSLPKYPFPYDLDNPSQTIQLPVALKEISGITFDKTEQSFYAIEDENGIIYQMDLSGKILNQFPFWKKGDYEDLVFVHDTIYVVKSTGTIYKVIGIGTDEQHFEKYNTRLSKKNDIEGLAYDSKKNCLLLACKGEPQLDENKEEPRIKAIYKFNLKNNELVVSSPVVISLDVIQFFLQEHPQIDHWTKFDESFGTGNDKLRISPSALAFHPISGNLYILSSKKKVLLILDQENNILHIAKLNKKYNIQPEGIAFSKNGDMYISNEGQELNGRIYKYSYR
ncbi:MAG TPA: hypothetical protein ENK75_05395 [Saprospiraceae bacterium]|nr:hypothetical protein [Saprospiraceae bacterium]